MSNYYKEFIQYLQENNMNAKTIHVIKCLLNKFEDVNIHECKTIVDLQRIIVQSKPDSKRKITTIVYVFSLYVKYLEETNVLQDDSLSEIIKTIERDVVWEDCKVNNPSKFIAKSELNDFYKKITWQEGDYALRSRCLIQCLYEGIYNESLTNLINLRASDISVVSDDNSEPYGIVKLNDDGEYEFKISKELAENLIELSMTYTVKREHKFGYQIRKIEGIYSDSCFKVEVRKSKNKSDALFAFKKNLYGQINRITTLYYQRRMSPKQIFVSGIMERICEQIKEAGIDLDDAFRYEGRNVTVHDIIKKELDRCHYHVHTRIFREYVGDYVDTFK